MNARLELAFYSWWGGIDSHMQLYGFISYLIDKYLGTLINFLRETIHA
jgi:hypothetical protein